MNEPGPPLLTGPTLAYSPKVTTELCEATKDLLLFMRTQGFRCTHVEVTDKGVLLGGLDDDFPAKQIHARGGGAVMPTPSYDHDFPEP